MSASAACWGSPPTAATAAPPAGGGCPGEGPEGPIATLRRMEEAHADEDGRALDPQRPPRLLLGPPGDRHDDMRDDAPSHLHPVVALQGLPLGPRVERDQ